MSEVSGKRTASRKASGEKKSPVALLSTEFIWSDDAPRNVDAESGVLASILLDESGEVMNLCMSKRVSEEYFFDPKNALIFAAMRVLHIEGKPIDTVLLSEKLRSRGHLEKVGLDYISSDILGRVETITNFQQWIEILREKHFLRKISRACVETLEKVRGNRSSIESLLDEVEKTFLGINGDRSGEALKQATDQVGLVVAKINQLIENKGAMNGVPTGFVALDRKLRGLHENEMIVIAGRPGTGKTSIALNIVESALFSNPPVPTLMFSLEMLADQLLLRMIAARARADMHKLGEGRLEKGKLEDITTTAKELKGAPLWIDDTSGMSILEMRASARRLNQKLDGKLGLIVVDYLQLLRATDSSMPREQAIAEISRGMKAMSKELRAPVIVLAQLNRDSEKDDRPPRPSDLRESGAIEQDADSIILLSHQKSPKEVVENSNWLIRVDLAKNRNGPTGPTTLLFNRSCTRYENYLEKDDESI